MQFDISRHSRAGGARRLLFVSVAALALGACEGVVKDIGAGVAGLLPDSGNGRAADASRDPRLAEARSRFDAGQPEQGVAILRPMAQDGNAEAQFLLGLAYDDGRGVARDRRRALDLFEAAAAQGHSDAAYLAGLAHYRGRGTPADKDRAVDYIRQAADAGHAAARYRMGLLHQRGDGVGQDPAVAVDWFRLSADQGFPEAAAALAAAYENGVGVAKDLPWAIRWHERAAGYGVAGSQFKAGLFLSAGRGVPVDREDGLKWLILADRNGDDRAAQVIEAARKRMTASAVRRAEAAARSWRADPAGTVSHVDAPTLRFVQASLNRMGYDAGPVDAIDGPRTRRAVGAFRQDRNLGPGDGIDRAFLSALREDT